MKHEDRRKEYGKMILDVSKYLVTVGLVGGVLTEKVSSVTGFALFAIAIIISIIGFYIIPPKKEEN